MKIRTQILFALLLTPLLGFAGCSDGLVSLKGQVNIDNEPAPAGVALKFTPLAEGGSPSYAETDENGRFVAAFTFKRKGVEPGELRVALLPGGGSSSRETSDSKPIPPLPREYFQEIMTITAKNGRNDVVIPLESKK